MAHVSNVSRRAVLGLLAAAPFASFAKKKSIPVGLELFSVRKGLNADLPGTLEAVAKMGYECVEFYSPYFSWTTDYAKQVRKQLDGLGVKCHSTHNSVAALQGDGIAKAIELNGILGARYVVLASAPAKTEDDWKGVAHMLNQANEKYQTAKLNAGYHNHAAEWKPLESGQKPMEILAAETGHSVALQLDVGTCVETGNDPVAWIEKNPGRIRSLHLKEWSPEKGYKVLFGEGVAPWKKIFAAAESKGGVEYYLIEQEGSDYPENETADRCLVAFQDLHK